MLTLVRRHGALPKSEISAFIDRVVKTAGGEAPGDQLSEAIEAAEDAIRQAVRGGMRLDEARRVHKYHALQTREAQ